jgi:hypothetical protein
MLRQFTAALILSLSISLFGVAVFSQQENSKEPAKPSELTPRRLECGILLPERDERHDISRLIRADQFLACERDGFPKHLAPPWKETVEAENKLGDACEYFATKSAREYPQLGQASLKLAADRCRINVIQITMMKLAEGLGKTPK